MPPTAEDLFGRGRALVGMVHVLALPGTPRQTASLDETIAAAIADARALQDAGFDALLIENMHDVPYLRRRVGPEIVAAMTAVARAVRDAVDLPLGVQILAGANREALAVAHVVGARFVRAEGFVFAAVADEGLLDQADAGPLLRYRRAIEADGIAVLADVKKKHSSHAITGDLSIDEHARAAVFAGADAIVVTGAATGHDTDPQDLAAVRHAVDSPVVAGSGGRPETLGAIFAHADALIVGSATKFDGDWRHAVDPERARALVAARDER